jgi:hypothetical protein
LQLDNNYPLSTLITVLVNQKLSNFKKIRGQQLLGDNFQEKCTLNLTPCPNCRAPRAFEKAKFCFEYGKPLRDVSVYEEHLKAPIDQLPLPQKKIETLKQQTSTKVVQDILLNK